MTPAKRKVLAKYGVRGDQVRAVEDATEHRVVVYYHDGTAQKRRLFPLTAGGRAEAKAFAAGWHQEREAQRQRALAPTGITTAALWDRYAAVELDGLRGATIINYRYHWRRWVAFIGADREAGTVTIEDCAQFRKDALAAGASINQARQTLQVVRGVYRWGVAARILVDQGVLAFRWKRRKEDPKALAPDEYTDEDFDRLLRATDRDDARQWKAWVFLMLAGHHGQRARAVLHLRWSDIDFDAGVIAWPEEYQKQGEPLTQPLLWETWSALLVARAWRERAAGYRVRTHHTGAADPAKLALADWVLFAERDKAKPMSYQSMHYHLMQAEARAKVPHRDFRAMHGFRRMVVGVIGEATGSPKLGLEYVGDRDEKQLKSYDRRRQARIDRASTVFETVRISSGNDNAPPLVGGASSVTPLIATDSDE